MTENEMYQKLLKQTDEFQSRIKSLSEKSDLCLDEIAEALLIYDDTQALLGYLPYINDETFARIETLLERADSMQKEEDLKSIRLFKEYKMWFDFIARMTDAQEAGLRDNLLKIKGFPENKLDIFIRKLRREWTDMFIVPEPEDVNFPNKGIQRDRDSRNYLLRDSWVKMNEYERGAIVNYIVRETGIDMHDTLKVLSHIGKALGSVEEWFRIHADQIDIISSNRDYRLLYILDQLYRQYFQKDPSHNPTGSFAQLVKLVLETKDMESDSERAICGIRNYLRPDRKSRTVVVNQRPYPGFEHIYIE